MINTLSKRLKELRLSMDLRQEQVAKLIGVNKSDISAYEDEMRLPSLGKLVRLANLFRVSTDYLLGVTDNRSLELSDLSEKEAAIVCSLVEMISRKNEILSNR